MLPLLGQRSIYSILRQLSCAGALSCFDGEYVYTLHVSLHYTVRRVQGSMVEACVYRDMTKYDDDFYRNRSPYLELLLVTYHCDAEKYPYRLDSLLIRSMDKSHDPLACSDNRLPMM